MKKIIILTLTAVFLAAMLTACAPEDTGDDLSAQSDENGAVLSDIAEEENEETAAELSFPDLPERHYEGYEFRILNTADGNITWLWTQLTSEEETGEALNDAIFRRNRRMEEKLGINLVQISVGGPGDVLSRMRSSVQSGGDDYDLGMTGPGDALTLAQGGMLVSIDTIPYIDLSQPWWDQDMNRDFSIGEKLFFTGGDFSFNQYSSTITILFNKVLHANLALDDPYRLVREGNWTLDKFGEMGRAALLDLNGDGVFDDEDQWGYMAFSHVYTPAIMNGIGAGYILRDESNIPYLGVDTEHFMNRFITAVEILSEGWLFDGNQRGMGRPEHIWEEGRSLFWSELLNWATTLRAMENDFGILPMPKYNAQQEYYIASTRIPHVKVIPSTTNDMERTGIILESLNAESRISTLTVYYDTMLVNQVMRDEESGEMLDVIFANKVYEIGRFFWETNIAGPISTAMAQGSRDIASVIERSQERAQRSIETTIEAFGDN